MRVLRLFRSLPNHHQAGTGEKLKKNDYNISLSRYIHTSDVLRTPYRADFLCYGSIIVELKTIKAVTEIEFAQVLHYLRATNLKRALLINFGTPRLYYKRFIQSKN